MRLGAAAMLEPADTREPRFDGLAAERLQRERDVVRLRALDRADEAYREVQLLVVPPARARVRPPSGRAACGGSRAAGGALRTGGA